MEEQVNPKSDLGNLSIKDLFFKYVRFLPLFILSVAIALLVAYVYLRYATPIFRSNGSMLIKSEQTQRGTDKFDELFMQSSVQNLQSEIEVLKSRPLMERVVRALDLETSYFAKGKIKSPNIYKQGPFVLQIYELTDTLNTFTLNFQFSGDNSFQVNGNETHFRFGQLFRNEHGVFSLQRTLAGGIGKEYYIIRKPTYLVAGELAGALSVAPKTTGTGILLLSIETTNSQMSADIVNELMEQYDSLTIEDKNLTRRQTLDFIDDRMNKLQHELDSVERQIAIYRQNNNIFDEEYQSSYYFEQFGEADKELNEQRLQLSVTNLVGEYLRDRQFAYELVPTSLTLQDATLNGLVGAYNQVQLDRKRLIDGGTPRGNALVKGLEQEIEKLRVSILELLKNMQNAYYSSINKLENSSTNIQRQIRMLPAKIRDLLEIERQKESKLELYKFLLEKREETAISEASTISNSKIIEVAYANSTPVKPNRRNIQLMALLIGLALPGLFIFLLELLNDKVNTRYDIEKITQAAILGEIGHSFAENALVVTRNSRSMVAEQFRIIRSNLQYVLNKIEKPVILVTSSFSGEGKSFISTNMAAVLALAGKKTIVLEFDIRKPKILSGLKLPKKAGITNFLVGKAQLEDLPSQVPGYDNLYVMGCGPVPPNPAELLLDARVTDLFAWLKQNFDVVIIDTAPVGMVSDAMTLGKFADCSLYIVRQGHTYKKQIALIDELYQQGKLPRLSIVLNDVKLKPGYGYYGYGRYGYGYGYGSGYYEEEKIDSRPRFMKAFDWLQIKSLKRKLKK